MRGGGDSTHSTAGTFRGYFPGSMGTGWMLGVESFALVSIAL